MPSYTFECQGVCRNSRTVYLSLAEHETAKFYCCKKPMQQAFVPVQTMRDIQPYRAVAVDKATGKAPMITSRSEHRDFLRRNNYIEIGNDIPKHTEPKLDLTTGHDVKRAIEKIKARK